jgi:X-X-X-Leu-X-X-Gly heptad repeat protein
MNAKAPRTVLAILLVVSLMPLANLVKDPRAVAYAEDAAPQPTTTDGSGAAPAAADPAASDPAAPAAAASDPAAPTTDSTAPAPAASVEDKEEVVYALLEGGGAPRTGYVVNHFQVDTAGTLVDHGTYQSTTNLSTIAELKQGTGQVSVAVEPGDFYYEGVLKSVDLPWLIDITYTLDGARIQPAQVAGASGKLDIQVKTRQNKEADPVFFKNYLLQIQMTLDSAHARDISAPTATIANAGSDKQVVFMVLPGREGDLTLSAHVTNFEMPGIQISALPFSMVFDIPDTTSMLDDMTSLVDAIDKLNQGAGKLKDGVVSMEGGAAELAAGSASFSDGLSLLGKNSTSLTAASSQIDGALAAIAQQLEGGMVDPNQLAQLISGLRQISAGLRSSDPSQPGLAEGLGQIQGGIGAAVMSMDSYVSALAPVGQQAIQELYADPAMAGLSVPSQATIGNLIGASTQAAYVRGAWYGPNGNDGVKGGLESAAAGLSQSIEACQYMAGQLDMIATGLESALGETAQLQTLAAYMQELSRNYTSFNAGLATYTGGLDTLAANYQTLNSGLAQFAHGVSDLSGGIASLSNGTSELQVNVKDLPETLQKEIDSFLADYQKDDFTPVSFISAENAHVARVQFVLRTDPIEVPAPPEEPTAPTPTPSFWDRLTALFT